MAKAYWVSTYFAVKDPAKLAAYAAIAGPALLAAGGRFLARGVAAAAYEAGMKERTVIVEFETLQAALAAYNSAEYAKALAALGDGAHRDIRIVEGA